MRKCLFSLVLSIIITGFLVSASYAQLTGKLTSITPYFLSPSETTTVFQNPADLTYYNYVFGGALTYGPYDQRFSGSIVVKTDDFGLGEMAAAVEYFGTNFAENFIWIDDPDGGHFSLTKGGYKQTFIWAKKSRFLRVGIDFKHYYYRELDTGTNERGLGFDAGLYITPFEDLLFGIYTTDIGGTRITDADNPSVLKRTIPNRTWLTATVTSGNDLIISAGLPTDILKDYQTVRGIWRKSSFNIQKIFSQTLITEIGYNSKDLFAGIGYKFNDFISIEYLVSNDLYVQDGVYRHLLMLSYGIPMDSANLLAKAFRATPSVVTAPFNPKNVGRPYNPWMDTPFWWMGIHDPTISRTVQLKNRKAAGLLQPLQDMLSPQGKISLDEPTNSLIITDYENNVMRIKNAAITLDQPAGETI